ncbi:MAG: hypothetical protein ABEJ80_05790 [Halarchaeum sp.]
MDALTLGYIATSAALVVAGLVMVSLAVQTYRRTGRRAMIHLSVGFVLVVAAAIATAVSALVLDFSNVRSLLLVNSGFTTAGYAFVIYSLLSY